MQTKTKLEAKDSLDLLKQHLCRRHNKNVELRRKDAIETIRQLTVIIDDAITNGYKGCDPYDFMELTEWITPMAEQVTANGEIAMLEKQIFLEIMENVKNEVTNLMIGINK